MRYLNLLLFTLLLLGPGFSTAAPGIGVAATVNGAEILERKLQTAVNNYMREQGSDVGAIRLPENFQEVRMKVLDVLIGQELLWQAAWRDDTVADDEAVDAALAQVRAGFDSDVDFEIKLQEGSYSVQSYREDLRRRLSAQQWVETRVLAKVAADDDAVSRFYEENKSEFAIPEQVRARHILRQLGADSSAVDRQATRELLEGIRQRVEAGEDFAALAREYSQDGSAGRGGDLGFFGPGMMVKPFEQAAFELEPGEMTDIVETHFGLHLIQLVERKPAGFVELAEVAEQIRAFLFKQHYQQALGEAVDELRQAAQIEINNL
jgi:parvulin-like peptidyl-prolyl isomerase